MYKEYKEVLNHILEECNYLLSAINNANIDKDVYLRDETLKRATVRSLEIIGEATKKIPDDLKQKISSVKWKEMAGMRDRLIHDYMGTNYNIVWDVIKNKIPVLKNQIEYAISNKLLD
ncbi:MAG: DUF86 domain-containing protein [Bacteroidetes bacterium]|nr:MAG: DUF86 domain-containing protein [Bacteroidota bacterium]